ncbi:hypothetical protein SAMN02745912_03875 [Paramaledivibacter caminithermalis DSM 15212]|uniref:DUF6199 domain-containing protein n=1 Tax=Paramaledivibacter caminithermalis (strain DSM 15212 / CIP 107654 / DViRD3) TaxID=1121301 RepID=A0A1M6U5J2_PARC5|nr:hypothetical protein SAMN02745912_03875 [Paramaledivibacter caminithermalis DSM 15212]
MRSLLKYRKILIFSSIFIVIIFAIPFLTPRFGLNIKYNFKYKETQILKDAYVKDSYSNGENNLNIIYNKNFKNSYQIIIKNEQYTVLYKQKRILLTLPNGKTTTIDSSYKHLNTLLIPTINSILNNDISYYLNTKLFVNILLCCVGLISLIYPQTIIFLQSSFLYKNYEPNIIYINIIRFIGIALLLICIGISLRILW